MCFPVPYAGFFAKRHMMFFLLSSFRFCPPLKNDGRSELRFASSIEWKLPQKNSKRKPSPNTGKVAALADERGKREQKGKNKKISMSKTNKKYSDLCTQTCPYRLARLGTSLRIRGKLTLRKKKYSFYYLNTLLRLSAAGFFAKSQIMFFSSLIIPVLPAAQE